MMRKRQLLVLIAAVACGTTEAPGPLEPSGPTGRVRFVNLITDTTRGRVNAILEGVAFGVNLTYGQSTPSTLPAPSTANYSAILAGSRTLLLKRTADTSSTVTSVSFTVTASQDQTIYAVGGAASSAVSSIVIADDNPAVAAAQTRIRLVNMSPTAGAVDVFVTAPNADLAAATPTFTNVANRAASTYATINAGTYQVRVVPAGTPAAGRTAAVVINVPSLALSGGTARTIVTADRSIGGAPLTSFVLTDR
ncbi:MAG TPA: DUF4397 domain-containing protein [Gemmatimonadaceae bacterium]